MRRLFFMLALLLPWVASAQPAPSGLNGGYWAGACSVITFSGSHGPRTMMVDDHGNLCVSATVSASITGFTPGSVPGTPITATTGGATGTLPAGAVVVATNVGTTNAAYCALGGSSSTSQQYLAPGGGWFAFTVGAATQLTCATSTSTTTVNMVGGSGLPTGVGGVGGSGGGGGTSLADEAAFTAGTTSLTPSGGFFQTTATSNALTNGQAGMAQMTANRAFFVNLRNASGAELGVAAAPLQVSVANTGSNATAVLVTGTGGTFPATQSGTWTVQPGNTANTTAWLVTGTGGTFPATQSGTWTVTGAGGTFPATIASGADVAEGAIGDAAWTSGNATLIALGKATVNALVAPLPAGTNIIGRVGIDQTTPGTTNGVGLEQIGSTTVLAGVGAVGAGSQRMAVGQDTTTIAGSAPGTAGSASANVVSVQGIASMTPLLENPGTAANWGIGATGSAPPANAGYTGVSSSGNMVGMVACDGHTFVHITSATDTLLVQGVTSKIVKICGVKANFTGSAAQSVYIENTASTNANCSSTKTQIGSLITGNSSAPFSDGFYNPIWGGFANTSGNGVCVNSSGTGVVDVEFWYTQGS